MQPLKVPPLTRAPARSRQPGTTALPLPGCPPLPPVWLRTSIAGASRPRCRRRNTARRFAPCRASPRCSGPSHGGSASAARLGSPFYESSGPRPALASRPYAAPSSCAVPAYGWGFRCPRIAPGRSGLAAIPPKLPPSRRPAAAAEQCLPSLLSACPGALPQTPARTPVHGGGEQLAPSGSHGGPVWMPPRFPDGIPALFLLYRRT